MRYVNDKDLGYNPIDNQLGTLEKRTLETSLFPVKPVSSPTASFLLWKL